MLAEGVRRASWIAALAALMTLALAPLATAPARATTLLRLDLESIVDLSEQVVVGRVEALRPRIEGGRVFTHVDIAVDRRLKGTSTSEQVTVRQIGGSTEELVTYVPGSPIFRPGEHVLVFLERPRPDGPLVVAGMVQGKLTLALGPDNKTLYAVPQPAHAALVEHVADAAPGQPSLRPAAPSPSLASPIPLSVLEARIMEVVQGQRPGPTSPTSPTSTTK